MSPAKWLDAAHELGKIRDELDALRDVWDDDDLRAVLADMSAATNRVVVACYSKGLRVPDER